MIVDERVQDFAQTWVDLSVDDGFIFADKDAVAKELAAQIQQLAEYVTDHYDQAD